MVMVVLFAACWFGWVGRQEHRPWPPGARSPPPKEIRNFHLVISIVIGISEVVDVQMLEK